jgi:virulence factor Mce-like protein
VKLRRRKHPQHQGMSRFTAGLITVVLLAGGSYFGFTKLNPFASPYELSAVFQTANNLKPGSPVRIAGVDIGKVKSVESIAGDRAAARVEMEIEKDGLPIHTDAELKVRPRIFLEGNFFVDVHPGSPSAPLLADGGDPIPMTQTAAPVQLGQILEALQSDTRSDLQVFLKEYSEGLAGEGARGFNESLRFGESAFRNSALANDATLGQDPDRDVQRLLRGQQRTFAALVRDETALKSLVTDFNTTAAAFAAEDAALEATLPALRDTLRVGQPALASLNDALPSLRAFAVDALPGTRSSAPTLRASLPFIRQARALVGEDELKGAARELRRQIPRLVGLNRTTVPFLRQARALSACTNEVLVPFVNSDFDDPDFPENTGTVNQKFQRSFVGLSGESRLSDANQSYFHTSAIPLALQVRPAPPTTFGERLPDRRPDVPCETQEPPNLEAPTANVAPGSGELTPRETGSAMRSNAPSPAERGEALLQAKQLTNEWFDEIALQRVEELRRLAGETLP